MGRPYRVWGGEAWVEVPVPPDDELTVVPNVNAIIYRDLDRREILLQRRDKPGEVVRGLWEVPGGRWAAGEPPDVALARELAEETGIDVLAVSGAIERIEHNRQTVWAARPLAVVSGGEGAYPSLHVVFECYGDGEPRPQPGETSDPTWWPIDELRDRLESHPEEFVAQTYAILRVVVPRQMDG